MDYLHCYRLLDLEADSDWNTVRQRYRTLAARHHPDRPHHDSDGPALTEINLAYQSLRDYYRHHQRLPLQEHASPSTPFQRRMRTGSPPKRWMVPLFVALSIAVAGLLLWPYSEQPATTVALPAPVLQATTRSDARPTSAPTGRIAPGDRLGHVAELMGPPDDTRGDRWYYGRSWIEFRDGRVTNWYSSVDTPLPTDYLHSGDQPSSP